MADYRRNDADKSPVAVKCKIKRISPEGVFVQAGEL